MYESNTLCGHIIANRELDPATLYTASCDVIVDTGVTLTVPGGTVVKFAAGTGLSVNGSLTTNGTAAAPVVFTSIKDDSIGGDTNGDGTVTTPAPADWNGITASGGTGTFSLTSTRVGYASQVSISNAASTTITGSTFDHGVDVYVFREDGSAPLTITGNTLTSVGAATAGLTVHTYDSTPGVINTSPTITNNTISGTLRYNSGDTTGGRALAIYGQHLDPNTLTGNTGTGNTQNATFVSGTLTTSATLPVTGLPWVLGSDYYSTLTINQGVTITINPGTIIKAVPGTWLSVNGSLTTNGTAAAPVVFTSIKDDSIGGDTNGDGTVTTPAPADWNGITASGGTGTFSLTSTRVGYASQVSISNAASTTITGSTFDHGVDVYVFREDGSAPLTITGNTLTSVGAATAGLTVHTYDSTPGVINTSPTITNNTISGTLRYNSGDTTGGRALAIYGQHLDPNTLTGNTGTGNTQNATFVSGTLTTSATLPVTGLPWVLGSDYYSTLTINQGVTITINPGTIIKAVPGTWLSVNGSLTTNGTAAAPVVFTSIKDDSIGGDTNGDGTVTTPAPADWNGITASGGTGTFSLTSTRVGYASQVSISNAASTTITGSTFDHGVDVYVFREDGSAPLTITGNTLTSVGAATAGLTVHTYDSTPGVINTSPTITNNTISGTLRYNSGDTTGGRALAIYGQHLDPNTLTGNTGTGNTQNATFVSGTLTTSATLPVTGLPWVLGSDYYSTLTINQGVTITINPGTIIKAVPGTWLSVNGSLTTNGTAAAPVVFTSIKDDSIGGDTNGDGTVTTPAPADWNGITASGGTGTFSLTSTRVGYASQVSISNAASTTITGSTFDHGVDVYVFREDGSAPLTITGNTLTSVGAATAGLTVHTYDSTPGVINTSPTITNNTISGTLRYNSGDTTGGRALAIYGQHLDPNTLTGNTGTGNTQNATFVSGTLTTSATLPVTGLPWVLGRNSQDLWIGVSCGVGVAP